MTSHFRSSRDRAVKIQEATIPATSNKGLEVQSTGSNSGTWGDVLNDNMITYVDTFLGGITSLSLTSSNVALTQEQARNVLLRMTGTLLANVSVSPDSGVLLTGFVYWENLTSGSFTVTFTNSAGSVVLPQSRRGIMWVDTTNGPRIVAIVGSSAADPIPVGTVMLFYQNAAPTGWTISSALNDYGLKIVSSAGGVTSGSVAYSTLFARTATDSHTLTSSEIPSHQHFVANVDSIDVDDDPLSASTILAKEGTGVGERRYLFGGSATAATLGLTSPIGGGDGHTHDIDMRLQTASVILATKN